jgi:hypothetical protein
MVRFLFLFVVTFSVFFAFSKEDFGEDFGGLGGILVVWVGVGV